MLSYNTWYALGLFIPYLVVTTTGVARLGWDGDLLNFVAVFRSQEYAFVGVVVTWAVLTVLGRFSSRCKKVSHYYFDLIRIVGFNLALLSILGHLGYLVSVRGSLWILSAALCFYFVFTLFVIKGLWKGSFYRAIALVASISSLCTAVLMTDSSLPPQFGLFVVNVAALFASLVMLFLVPNAKERLKALL